MTMKSFRLLPVFVLGAAFLAGCAQIPGGSSRTYNVTAYKPRHPGDVRVLVSLRKEQVYVMEGSRPLLIAATTIGIPAKPTPRGHFTVERKESDKRSGSYGFWARGDDVRPGTSEHPPGGGYHYVGYPMPWWVEWEPEYGFHQGYVWPVPHSHGCLRLHPNVAPKFFALVRIGTPVDIAETQPEDSTIGANVPRPHDYTDPDPDPRFMASPRVFTRPEGTLLEEQP